jgi:hypothetical protein
MHEQVFFTIRPSNFVFDQCRDLGEHVSVIKFSDLSTSFPAWKQLYHLCYILLHLQQYTG